MTNISNVFTRKTIPGKLGDSSMAIGMPDDEYHAGLDIQSCSMLKGMLQSPAHYLASLTQPRKASDAMDFGTVVHLLVLQPSLTMSRIAIYPGCRKGGNSRDTKEFLEFERVNGGKMVIDEPMFHECQLAADRLLHTPIKSLGRQFGEFVAEGTPEATIYFTDPDTGVNCRTRMDLWHPEVRFDVKTTAFANSVKWTRHALDLHYDFQAYMYSLADCLFRGSDVAAPFYFMTVESDDPYSTHARMAGESFLAAGGQKYRHAIAAYAACSSSGYWPAPGGEEVIEITPWQVPTLDRSWSPA